MYGHYKACSAGEPCLVIGCPREKLFALFPYSKQNQKKNYSMLTHILRLICRAIRQKKFRCNTVEEFNNRPENSRNKKCPTNLKDVFQFFGHPKNPCKASLLCAWSAGIGLTIPSFSFKPHEKIQRKSTASLAQDAKIFTKKTNW